MSLEIQEWSHKSRSRINNLYLLTRPITDWQNMSACDRQHQREQNVISFDSCSGLYTVRNAHNRLSRLQWFLRFDTRVYMSIPDSS